MVTILTKLKNPYLQTNELFLCLCLSLCLFLIFWTINNILMPLHWLLTCCTIIASWRFLTLPLSSFWDLRNWKHKEKLKFKPLTRTCNWLSPKLGTGTNSVCSDKQIGKKRMEAAKRFIFFMLSHSELDKNCKNLLSCATLYYLVWLEEHL